MPCGGVVLCRKAQTAQRACGYSAGSEGGAAPERMIEAGRQTGQACSAPTSLQPCTDCRASCHAPQRSGRREELLHGPLWYAVAHVAATLLFWRHSPAGVVALSVLCGGDGLAEVVGAGLAGGSGSNSAGGKARGAVFSQCGARLPHNPDKSWAGSLACWLGGVAVALPLLARFRAAGMFVGMGASAVGLPAGGALLAGVLLCSAVGAAVESLPLREADNLVVTAATALTARTWFGF